MWWRRTDPEKIESHTEATANKGTIIHGYIEDILSGKDEQNHEDWARPAMEHFEKFVFENELKPTFLEITMASKKLGLGGTCDYIGTLNGDMAIIDWKTGAFSRKQFCQLALYMYIYWELTGRIVKNLYVANIHRDGKPVKLYKCPDPLSALRAGLLAFERWKWENDNQLKWASAPIELVDNWKASRGRNRKAIEEDWTEDYNWKWLEKDSLQNFKKFAILYNKETGNG